MTPGAAIPPPTGLERAPAPRRRCARHEEREAVGRCTACGGGFCRECLTEHEDRLYCGTCFTARVTVARKKPGKRVDLGRVKAVAIALGSSACLALAFYGLGRVLAAIPPDVHDGTIWKTGLEE